jgi:hypothetical protein
MRKSDFVVRESAALAQRLLQLTNGGELEVLVSESSLKSGAKVSFRLNEVVCPDLQQILTQLTSDLELTGRVVFFSDYGDKKNHFAIIDVDGVLSPMIVPVSRLQTSGQSLDDPSVARRPERS